MQSPVSLFGQLGVAVAAAFHGADEGLQLGVGFALRRGQLALRRGQGIDHLHPLQNELTDGGDLAIVLRYAGFEPGGH